MSKLFVADPVILKQEGNKLDDLTTRFNENVESIYNTVEEMLSTSYVSPAARELGQKILSYKGDLDNMTKAMAGYANYCHNASSKVAQNEDKIVDSFKVNATDFVGGNKDGKY